jgi:hypothetical protein
LSAALLRNPFQPAPAAQPAEVTPDETQGAEEFIDGRAPFAVRMRVILGSAILLWALILWAAGVL